MVDNENRLTSSTKKKATRYIEKYYDLIKDDKDFNNKVIEKCRG